MLQSYLSTVVIYAIIILCVANIFKDKFIENGKYVYGKNSNRVKLTDGLINLFLLAAVPVLRLYIVVFIIFIAIAKKETLDALKANVESKKS